MLSRGGNKLNKILNTLSALNTRENREAKLLSNTKVKMVGPAANVTNADKCIKWRAKHSKTDEKLWG
ncbi:hypothetical protein MHD_11230 [Mannheimia granulomatis]|uniref:Uncharacterized protein n=1 Tax=Mannheimia granulomatis TaxID=85402 RepID=A0A011NCJ8_9PAST|nr:hypothetical protein [Mannheimia granulomatis]EXI62120.1 hypothetical protein AK33_06680 [Mannheimia granulomatis]RGE47184.1 hypothetical protein MHD_11230 [Mannheimia granulomatis]